MLDRQIQDAVSREVGLLMQMHAAPALGARISPQAQTPRERDSFAFVPLFRSSEQAVRCLRIEVTTDVYHHLEAIWRGRNERLYRASRETVGPTQLNGVALYELAHPATLPPPGWRVVNPFRMGG